MLEQQQNQLVTGLQELYALVIRRASWKGAPLKESVNGHPLTHDILERLGVLRVDVDVGTDAFEEDLDLLRHKLAVESDSIRSPHPGSLNSDYQSQFSRPEVTSPRNHFGDSFYSHHQFPPTPPIQSPNGETPISLSPVDCHPPPNSQTGLDPSVLQPSLPLINHQQSALYDESLDFLNFDPTPNFDMSNAMLGSTSPCLSISPWLHDDPNSFGLKPSDT